MEKGIKKFLSGKRYALTRELIARLETMIARRCEQERKRIHRALSLMIQVHQGQTRHGGAPYYQHILSVATQLLADYPEASTEMVIAALLHDSVEDEPGRILQHLSQQQTREMALAAIREDAALGARASQLVAHLTNPLPDPAELRPQNQVYQEHVLHLFDEDPHAFVIKLADFGDNAFKLGALPEGQKKEKLKAKYGPVIQGLIQKLETLENQAHPLFAQKTELIQKLSAVYHQHYQVV